MLLVVPVLVGAGPGAQAPVPRGTWIEVRTDNFVLHSNAQEKLGRDVARQLELFRLLLGRIASRVRLDSPAPTTMLVFDAEKSFAPYRDDPDVRGMFARRTDGNFAAFIARPYIAPSARNLDQSAHFPYDTVYHEYVHYVLENSFSNIPRWLDEGMAQYYATFRLDGQTAQFGFPRSVHLNNMKYGRWIPLGDMLSFGPMSRHDSLTAMFYCQSWFATHYILSGDAARLRKLDRYLQLLEQGIPSDQAFRDAFETDPDAFTAELRRYLAGNQFYMASAALDPPRPVSIDVSPMSPSQVLTQLGTWLARMDARRFPDAEAHFREALRLTPGYAPAEVGLGYVLDRTDRPSDAEQAYRRALEAEAGSYLARFHFGWHLLARVLTAPVDADPAARDGWLDQARAHFAGCGQDRPEFAEAHFGLGLTYLHRVSPSVEGQAAIERAWRATPARMDIGYHAALLALVTGNTARADEILRRLVTRFPGLLLEYVSLPPEFKWHTQIAVPPSSPAVVAPRVARLLALVPDAELRAGLEEWTARVAESEPLPATVAP